MYLCRYVPPHRVGFLWLFWSGIGYGFQGNYGVYEHIYRFNLIEMDFKNFLFALKGK